MSYTTATDNINRRDIEPEAEPACALCGDPIHGPEDLTPLQGFDGRLHPLCAAAYCRQHDEFDCQEEIHAS